MNLPPSILKARDSLRSWMEKEALCRKRSSPLAVVTAGGHHRWRSLPQAVIPAGGSHRFGAVGVMSVYQRIPRVYHANTKRIPRVYHRIPQKPRVYHAYTARIPRVYRAYTTRIPQKPRVYHAYTARIPRVYQRTPAYTSVYRAYTSVYRAYTIYI